MADVVGAGGPPPDQAARDRIERDLGATLFVDAGAGSGKTRALVSRVLALVTSGEVELGSIAAITFTEKAGAELRDRIGEGLERRGDDLCRAALDQLDGCAIGTLHSFAQRILSEHPVEAGLPPRIEVLDEVSSGVEFERRWTAFRDQLLEDPDLQRSILLLLSAGAREAALRVMAVAFNDNWDLVDERVPASAPEPPPVKAALEPALAQLEALCADRSCCPDTDDKLFAKLCDIDGYAQQLRAIDNEYDLLEVLREAGRSVTPGQGGKTANWPVPIKDVKDRIRAASGSLDGVRKTVAGAAARKIAAAIHGFTLAAAAERRNAGLLEFHDLLVLARHLLRDPVHGPAISAQLRARYQRLLLDEFQDTDPIQIELAERIAGDDAAGRLFMVGDAKQSIYRFRRADIGMFLAARTRYRGDGSGLVELTANFRTAQPVIDWVNTVFARLMAETPDIGVEDSQPQFVALDAVRPAAPSGPGVAVLGSAEHPQEIKADELRAAEADSVAAAVSRVVAEGWEVRLGEDGWRPAQLGDIAILVPARTSLPFLEDALDEAGVPFRTESSSLVYATRAVRDLLMVLRAADDKTDYLRIVSALRTPLLACGDDDLFRFKVERHGRWSYLASQPDSVPAEDPVASGLAYLRSLHDSSYWSAPSELLDRIVRDRRALELGFAEGRPRDVWRRVRFVIDQARAWSEATGGSLRQYLYWVDQQTAEGARVSEPVLPETDDDAVRIMTIHSAKGLEFPVTIVSGMTTAPQHVGAPVEVLWGGEGEPGYRFWGKIETPEYEQQKPIDEQMDFHERIRLLYVACTRACDHLIVSLHRRARAGEPANRRTRTSAELLVEGMGADRLGEFRDVGAGPDESMEAGGAEPGGVEVGGAEGGAAETGAEAGPGGVPTHAAGGGRPSPPPPFEGWAAERASALARASVPTAVAATALTESGEPETGERGESGAGDGSGEPGEPGEADPGLQKRPRDMDLPPWLKGRYGTSVGRAVHGVLQSIDLATGAGLDAAVAAQCEAEAVPDRLSDVRQLVEHALASACVREAAGRPHWREVYACTPLDGRLLEGYVDLLYRSDEGLVVVDYKTAATSDPDELDRRVEGYRFQGASYALAVGAATGEPVVRVTFLFLTRDGAVACDLPNLEGAVAEVRGVVLAGREVVVD